MSRWWLKRLGKPTKKISLLGEERVTFLNKKKKNRHGRFFWNVSVPTMFEHRDGEVVALCTLTEQLKTNDKRNHFLYSKYQCLHC